MYLVEIDSDGLVKDKGLDDGLHAIPEFRLILQKPEFGRACMTAIALSVDWLSPIKYMSVEDRPKKAMYMIAGNRKAFPWHNDLIQAAVAKYKELQFNPALAEKATLDNMLINQLSKIELEKNNDERFTLFKELKTIKELIEAWNKSNENLNVYADSPVDNGHSLYRLEEKAYDKSSFYNKN